MTLSFDTSKISQAAARKVTLHDNCIVLDVGTGSFPRDIEVRLPDDDGARQIAIWDGNLDLAVDDEVLCNEYSGNPKWRVVGMGGDDSGAGKTRINQVWALDFTSVSLVTDASDNVTINTGTLTLPSKIIHLGDTDNEISFTDDVQTFTVGGEVLLTLTEAAQDVVKIGDGGDVDINFNDDGFFEGSSGFFGVGTNTPKVLIAAHKDQNQSTEIGVINQNVGVSARAAMRFFNDGSNLTTLANTAAMYMLGSGHATLGNWVRIINAGSGGGVSIFTGGADQVVVDSAGLMGVNGVTAPTMEIDMGDGAIHFEERTSPAAGATNTARLYARDSGGGKTQLVVRFNTGAVQVIATEP